MAKFGLDEKKNVHERVYEETVAHQHVPGRAYDVDNPSMKLIHTIGGGFFNEPKYYDSNRSAVDFYSELARTGKISSRILDATGLTEQAREVLETAQAIADSDSPEDLLIIASWARDPDKGLKLRTTPQILLALAAASPNTKPFVRRYAAGIMRRPDEIPQVFAAFRHLFQSQEKGTRHKGSLPHSLRKGIAETVGSASLYSLLKYSCSSQSPSLADVLKMVGGSKKLPKQQGQVGYPLPKGVYDYLVNGKVTDDAPEMIKARQKFFSLKKLKDVTPELLKTAGLTWENITSHFGSSKDVWEMCIPLMGEMALTRNLRNFEDAKISKTAWDKVYEKVGKIIDTRQLPFRFFTAYRATKSTEARTLVAQQLDSSVANVPDLPGVTAVMTDNSGSATGCPVSGKSDLRVSDAGNTLAAIVAKRFGRNALVGAFGDHMMWVPFNQADSTISIKQKIDKVAQEGDHKKYDAKGCGRSSYGRSYGKGVGGGTETGLWFAIDDLTQRKVHIDRFLLLSDLCCYTQGDNNCGVNMNTYFGKGGQKATVQSMLDRYRQQVNPNLQVYSINLNGHAQSQLRTKDSKNHLLSGWSEQIFNVIRDVEDLASQTPAEPVEIPALEALRVRYRKQA